MKRYFGFLIVLALALAACTGKPVDDAVAPLPPSDSEGASLLQDGGDALPAELVGNWIQRGGSGSSYYDPATGSYGAPNAKEFAYTFYPNGNYEHAVLLQSSLYNCTMTFFGYESGTVKLAGSDMTVVPQKATIKSQDSCVAANSYEKPGDSSASHFVWRVEGAGGSRQLVLVWDNGFEEIFVPDVE